MSNNKLKLRKFQEGVDSMPSPEMEEMPQEETQAEGVDIKAMVEEYLMQPSFEAQQQLIGMLAEIMLPQEEPMQNESGLPQFKKGGSMKTKASMMKKKKFPFMKSSGGKMYGKDKMMEKGGKADKSAKQTLNNKAYEEVMKNGYLKKETKSKN